MPTVPLEESLNRSPQEKKGFRTVYNTDVPYEPTPEETSFVDGLFATASLDNSLAVAYREGSQYFDKQLSAQDTTKLTWDSKYQILIDNPILVDTGHTNDVMASSSMADVNELLADINFENKQREIISRMSTTNQLLTGIVSGTLDPLIFLPGGTIYKSLRLSSSALKSAASTSLYSIATVAGQETLLHSLQETRSFEESMGNAIGAGVLGAAFGGIGGAYFSAAAKTKMVEDMSANTTAVLQDRDRKIMVNDDDSLTMQVSPSPDGMIGGGAALSEDSRLHPNYFEKIRKENSLHNIPKFMEDKLKHTPFFWLITSSFGAMRKFGSDIMGNASVLTKHTEGKVNNSIEVGMRQWINASLNAQTELDKAYIDYIGINSGFLKLGRAEFAAKQKGKMTRDQFSEEVYRAGYNGDIHAEPAVQKAIQAVRPFFEKMKNEAVKLGLMDENVNVVTAMSYMMRLYNRDKIVLNRYQAISSDVTKPFQNTVEDWLIESQNKIIDIKPDYDEFSTRFKAQEEIVSNINKFQMMTDAESVDFFKSRGITTENWEEILNSEALKLTDLKLERQERFDAKLFDSKGELYPIIGQEFKTREYVTPEERTAADSQYRALITAQANDIIDNIIGLGTDMINNPFLAGRAADLGGGRPLKSRVFKIPDELIHSFLEKDMNRVIQGYTRGMAFAIESTRYAKSVGVPEGESILTYFRKMAKEEYDLLAKTSKNPVKLNKEFEKGLKYMEDTMTAIQGFYGTPQGIMVPVARWLNGIKQWQAMRLLGMIAAYTPTDIALPVFHYRFKGLYEDGIKMMFQNPNFKKLNKDQANDMGMALEVESGRLFQSMVNGQEAYHDKSKWELVSERASRGFGNLSGANQIEDIVTSITGNIIKADIVRKMIKWKNNKLTKKDIQELSTMGINDYAEIYKQLERSQSLEPTKGSYLMNLHLWDNTDEAVKASQQIKNALYLMTEQHSFRTSFVGDKPLWTRTTLGSALFLFKNFIFGTFNKLLINSGVQRRDVAAAQGAAMLYTMGGVSYALRQLAYGREIKEEDVALEALDNSGLLAWLMEPTIVALKFAGVEAFQNTSRRYNRGDWSMLLGPTFGLVEDVSGSSGRMINALFGNENYTEKNFQQDIRQLPGSNWFAINPLITLVSRQVANTFDLETIEELEKNK